MGPPAGEDGERLLAVAGRADLVIGYLERVFDELQQMGGVLDNQDLLG